MDIEPPHLHLTVRNAFTRAGLSYDNAEVLARELTAATLAGYESHGIGRVRTYVDALKSGDVKASAQPYVVRESAATALLDGDQGIGILVAIEAARIVAQKAQFTGIAAVSVRNCGDVARLAPYAERIAREGLIGILMANDAGGGIAVAPHGSPQALFSTNPIAAGIPRPQGQILVFDFATSQIAMGAARAAARRHESVPPEALIDHDGNLVSDPEALFSGLASLLPLGGLAFGFKGTALALLVEALAGGLSGDGLSGDAPERQNRNALFLLAINPEAFLPHNDFETRVEALLARLRACPPIPGAPTLRIPGERAQHREGSRIAVPEALWADLQTLSMP